MALTGAAALTVALTACDGSAVGTIADASPKPVSGNAAPAPGDSPTAAGTTAATSTSGSTGTSGTSGSGGGKASGTTGATGGSGGGSVSACQASQLGYSWAGTKSASGGGQTQATVALSNNSGHACTMYGFPGVDLVNSGQQWSLQRDATTPHKVTVASGASAHFTITYLPSRDGDSDAFKPTTVVITAPDQRSSHDLPWRFGPVVLQDGATHPGTFIGPVGS